MTHIKIQTPSLLSGPFLAFAVALAIFAIDAVTKLVIHVYTPYGWSHSITSFFNLVHVWNLGAAFSFLANAGGWQRYFFVTLAALVCVYLVWYLRKPLPPLERWAGSLILGGALGNGFDRAVRGYVVDFLDFHIGGWHWPAFNFADVAIVCGAALMILSAIHRPDTRHKSDAA
jgi:signal peptidase II